MVRPGISMFVLLAVAAASCTLRPLPVPVIARPSDAAALVGTWDGEYHSSMTQRYGSIRFVLAADSDSASGDVLMLARHTVHRPRSDGVNLVTPEVAPRTLSIRFVVAERDTVYGLMNPYPDDDGALLVTRFVGLRRGNQIDGHYLTWNLDTSEISTGQWSGRRKRP